MSTDPSPASQRFERLAESILQAPTEGPAFTDLLNVLLDTLLDTAIAVGGAERAFVVVRDSAGKLTLVRIRNFDDPISPGDSRTLFARTPIRLALDAGVRIVSLDARNDDRFNESGTAEELGLHLVVVEPLVGSKGLVGALVLDSRTKARGPYTEVELDKLRNLAAKAARVAERLRGPILSVAAEEERRPAAKKAPLGMIAGASSMKRVLDILQRAANVNSNVLVTGETGTGKELVARALHECGPRARGKFVAVNLGTLGEALAPTELFGHEAGAFTGATKKTQGLFFTAHGGTLFLDEIGELALPVQAMLLRALQEGTVRSVGGREEVPVDVRIVAATNRDLLQMVVEGTFREDLYYRLSVVTIELPPLRKRKEDIAELARVLLEKLAKRNGSAVHRLSKPALARLMSHSWPGNIRELSNALERAMLEADGEIRPEHLQLHGEAPEARPLTDKEAQTREFVRLYNEGIGVKEIAKSVGIAESTAHLWIDKLGKRGDIKRRPRR